MYTLPVTGTPSKYTTSILKYTPKRFGWEVVKMSNRVFEFPPGTIKNVDAHYLESILKDRVVPQWRNILKYEMHGTSTKDGTAPGYYNVCGKLIRVGLPKPHQQHIYSVNGTPADNNAIEILGESGMVVKTTIGQNVLTWAMVSPRPFIDVSTFYKFVITQPSWIYSTYIDGVSQAYDLVTSSFPEITKTVTSNVMYYDGKSLLSKCEEYTTTY